MTVTLMLAGRTPAAAERLYDAQSNTRGVFGRIVGVVAAGLNAIVALLSISGSGNPFWSLALFSLSIIVIHQLTKRPDTA